MQRLIDADALDAQAVYMGETDEWVIPINELKRAPTIDSEPVCGEWLTICGGSSLCCSVCSTMPRSNEATRYCHSCGARMT